MLAARQSPLETKAQKMKARLRERFLELREELKALEREAKFLEARSEALKELAEQTADHFRALEFGWDPGSASALKQSLRKAGYSVGL